MTVMGRAHRTTWCRIAAAIVASVALALPVSAAAACGGSERWPVKVASDPEAHEIDAGNVTDISIADFNKLKPSDVIASNDEFDRMEIEKRVYRVHGFLALYKLEPDGDYHLAATDETGKVTKGGQGSTPTGHSFVAEIPGSKCFAGKHGQYPAKSVFASEIAGSRKAFEAGVANLNAKAIAPGSVPVTITGVVFFDFDHGQVGRASVHKDANGKRLVIELHPILAIKFEN